MIEPIGGALRQSGSERLTDTTVSPHRRRDNRHGCSTILQHFVATFPATERVVDQGRHTDIEVGELPLGLPD
jgi:hypothetical protein